MPKFKWIATGCSHPSDSGEMYFIAVEEFEPAMMWSGEYSERQIAKLVVAQAQSAEWAKRITDALNAA